MSALKDAFNTLGKVLLGMSEDIPGDSLADVVDYIADHYVAPTGGEKGDPGDPGAAGADGADGASLTAIALTVDGDGAVTGGTATLSDETTVNITVTSGT